MATVSFEGATRIYPGNPKPSVDTLDLDIEDGEFLVPVGPSGCGKSTSLRMLAGQGFIGSPATNVVEIPIQDGVVALGGKPLAMPEAAMAELAQRGRDRAILGFRPADIRIANSETSWPVHVTIVEGLGADAYVHADVNLPDGATKQVVTRTDGRTPPKRGDELGLEIVGSHMHLFDPETHDRLHHN